MPEIPKPRPLRMELDPTEDNLLEQLVASVQRIALGLDTTYAAIVRMDSHVAALTASPIREPMVSATYINGYLEVMLRHGTAMDVHELLKQLVTLREWVKSNSVARL